MSRSIRHAPPEAPPAPTPPLALERVVPVFVALAVVLATFIPPSAFAATRNWSMTATPRTFVDNQSATVTLTVTNTGDGGDAQALGCAIVAIPTAGFTVTGVAIGAVSDGAAWSASWGVVGSDTLVQLTADSDLDRLDGAADEWLRASISITTTGSDGTYDWVGDAFNLTSCADGFGSQRTVTMGLNAGGSNAAPAGQPDAYTTPWSLPLSVAAPGVLGNDTDADGDPLTAELVSPATRGVVSLNSNGSFTYWAPLFYVGSATFQYRAFDGIAYSSSVTVTISIRNDPPSATDDGPYALTEDGSLTVPAPGVLANDADPNGDALTASLVSGPSHGVLSLAADGSFVYTPDPDYDGPDSFTYAASDGIVASSPATVTLDVGSLPDQPEAVDDGPYETDEDETLVVDAATGVLANDADADGDPITAVLVTPPAHGTLTLDPDGSFVYVPDPDFHGPDTFTYRVDDGLAASDPATVEITVSPRNDAPDAVDDAFVVDEDDVLVAGGTGVLANDSDVDGDALTVSLVSGPAKGSLALAADGTFTYTPDADVHGVDAFTYQVADGNGGTAKAVAQVDVAPVNDRPVARDDSASTDHATSVTVDVVANDTDVDGDTLGLDAVGTTSAGSVGIVGGKLRFTPSTDFVGSTTITYSVGDGTLADTGRVTITVSPAPPPPPPTPSPSPEPEPTPVPAAPVPPSPDPAPQPSDAPSPVPAPTPRSVGAVLLPEPEPPTGPGAAPLAPAAPALAPRDAPELTTSLPSSGGVAFDFTSLFGAFGGGFAWAAPAVMLTVPGLLFMFVVVAQVLGAAAWVPAVRRSLAGVGFSRRRRPISAEHRRT